MTSIDSGAFIALITFATSFVVVGVTWLVEATGLKTGKRRRQEAGESFDKIVDNLSSENPSAQLSSAVLVRQFLSLKIGSKFYLHKETVDVISSLLRTLSTGVYQKTLADGLAYAQDLSGTDLQRVNLQNVFLTTKSDRLKKKKERLKLHKTDLFMANLSYGLIENVDAMEIILYNAMLYGTIIKNSDFTRANFADADLTNVRFTDVILKDADFSRAINIPDEVRADLNEKGIYTLDRSVSTPKPRLDKVVFFSMPGSMSKADDVIVKAYHKYLRDLGYEVIYYTSDTYPRFGQLTQIKASIEKCSAMIAFGTCQTYIKEGIYRPGMAGEKSISDTWLSTPWNEVEVGMATMTGMPILLVKDENITDGIFDDIISEVFISTLSSRTDIKELDRHAGFRAWRSELERRTATPASQS